MSNEYSKSDVEKAYRDLVLKELQELNDNQKENSKLVGEMLDRMKTIEVVLMGVDGKNGLRHRVEELEKSNKELQKFKTQIVTIFIVVQTVIIVSFALLKLLWK